MNKHILIYFIIMCLIMACNKEGKHIEYYNNGNIRQIRFYKNDKLDSIAQNFDSNGKLELELNYKKGLLNGYNRVYQNGKLKSESFFVNDVEHGWVKSWYDNGQLQSIDYRIHGIGQGKEIHYYKNGNLFSEGQNKDDARAGIWKFYYENGFLEKEGQYFKGMQSGIWKFYTDKGDFIRHESF